MFNFTPETIATPDIKPPFIEDARADFAPFYSTKKSVADVQGEISAELGKLGGLVNQFRSGWFGEKPRRYGYEILFTFKGSPGLIRVARLPMRTETPTKKEQVAVQALCIAREWIKQMVTAKIFMPGTEPLLQYVLVEGSMTLADYMMTNNKLPLLAAPAKPVVIVEAE